MIASWLCQLRTDLHGVQNSLSTVAKGLHEHFTMRATHTLYFKSTAIIGINIIMVGLIQLIPNLEKDLLSDNSVIVKSVPFQHKSALKSEWQHLKLLCKEHVILKGCRRGGLYKYWPVGLMVCQNKVEPQDLRFKFFLN